MSFYEKSFSLFEIIISVIVITMLLGLLLKSTNIQFPNKNLRDLSRINQIEQLDKIIKSLLMESSKLNLGSSSVLYLSLPMKTATTNCKAEYPDLPDLPAGWSYHCVGESSLKNTDGSGWLPIDLSSSVIQIKKLPVDPVNNDTYFFAYTADNTKKSYEILVIPESENNKGIGSISEKDSGTSIYLYETGNDLTLTPNDIEIALGVPSGELIWATTKDFGLYWDDVSDIALDENYIYIAGNHQRSLDRDDWEWVIGKIRKKDGYIEYTTTVDPVNTGSYDFDNIFGGLVVDNDYIYIAGRQGAYYGTQLRLEKRDKNTLELRNATTSSNFDTPLDMEADSDYLYISGFKRRIYNYTSDYYWVIEKRRKSDLGLEWVKTINPSVPYSICSPAYSYYCLCFDGDYYPKITLSENYIFIGGSQGNFNHTTTTCGTIFGRIEKRDKNGNLISYTTTTKWVSDLYSDGSYLYISASRLEKRNLNLNLEKYLEGVSGVIKVFGNYIYLGTYEINNNDYKYKLYKVKKDDLSLIWTKTENPSNNNKEEYVEDIEIDSSGLYVGGSDGNTPGDYHDVQLRIERRNK